MVAEARVVPPKQLRDHICPATGESERAESAVANVILQEANRNEIINLNERKHLQKPRDPDPQYQDSDVESSQTITGSQPTYRP